MNSAEMEHNDIPDEDGDDSQKFSKKNEIEEPKNKKEEANNSQKSEVKIENEHNESKMEANNGNSSSVTVSEETKSQEEIELGLVMECEVIHETTEAVKELDKIDLWCLEWSEETDDRVRECTIHLMTTRGPVDGPLAFHWALKFIFEDGYTATYEAGLDKRKSGKLIPEWRIGGPECGDSWRNLVWDEWCAPGYKTSPCSPLRVNQVARNLHINSTLYHAINNNGQKWAKSIAFPFGVELPLGAASTAGRMKVTDTSFSQQDCPEE